MVWFNFFLIVTNNMFCYGLYMLGISNNKCHFYDPCCWLILVLLQQLLSWLLVIEVQLSLTGFDMEVALRKRNGHICISKLLIDSIS